MARGLNKVMLIGNLGQDPDIRHTPNGNMVANFSIATTDTWLDKQSGQKQERTEWSRCNAFGKLAEIIQQYVKKGSKVYVEGSLATRKWTDQQGIERFMTEIKVRDLQMLDSRQGQGNSPQGGYQGNMPQQGYQQPPNQGYQQPPGQPQGGPPPQQGYGQGHPGNAPQGGPPPQQGTGNPPPPAQNNHGAPNPGSFDDFDDDIPF